MVTCKNCKSINVDIKNLDYARAIPEGFSNVKYTGPHHSFYCYDCESQWKSESKDWQIYYEYRSLADKNRIIAHDMHSDGSYQSQELGSHEEYDRQKELASEIVLSYKHLLNLEVGVWFEIEQDVKNNDNSPEPRGEITDHSTLRDPEGTKYNGSHFVECYAIDNGICTARSRQNVVLKHKFGGGV